MTDPLQRLALVSSLLVSLWSIRHLGVVGGSPLVAGGQAILTAGLFLSLPDPDQHHPVLKMLYLGGYMYVLFFLLLSNSSSPTVGGSSVGLRPLLVLTMVLRLVQRLLL